MAAGLRILFVPFTRSDATADLFGICPSHRRSIMAGERRSEEPSLG